MFFFADKKPSLRSQKHQLISSFQQLFEVLIVVTDKFEKIKFFITGSRITSGMTSGNDNRLLKQKNRGAQSSSVKNHTLLKS